MIGKTSHFRCTSKKCGCRSKASDLLAVAVRCLGPQPRTEWDEPCQRKTRRRSFLCPTCESLKTVRVTPVTPRVPRKKGGVTGSKGPSPEGLEPGVTGVTGTEG